MDGVAVRGLLGLLSGVGPSRSHFCMIKKVGKGRWREVEWVEVE